MDLTRPFPSSRPVFQPSWEFVWNRWLSTSWRSIGLEHVCPPLLQVQPACRFLVWACLSSTAWLTQGTITYNKGLHPPATVGPGNMPSRMLCCWLQGMCEVRTLRDFDGAPYQYALLSRRSRLHVGPRYKARGLNEVAEPGNEIECEQVRQEAVGSGLQLRRNHQTGESTERSSKPLPNWHLQQCWCCNL